MSEQEIRVYQAAVNRGAQKDKGGDDSIIFISGEEDYREKETQDNEGAGIGRGLSVGHVGRCKKKKFLGDREGKKDTHLPTCGRGTTWRKSEGGGREGARKDSLSEENERGGEGWRVGKTEKP